MSDPPEKPGAAALGRRVKHGLDRGWRLIVESGKGFSRHRCTQLSASMSYYALFSVFPAAIVAAAVAGLILDDSGARMDAVTSVLNELPVSTGEGRDDIEQVVDGVADNSRTIGLIGLVALLISASALMSAARNSLNTIHGDDVRRGLLRGKGLDLLVIVVLGLLFSVSFGATLLTQLQVTLSGNIGAAVQSVIDFGGALLPLVLAAALFAFLYSFLPVERQRLRDIWPGVLLVSVGYELLKRGFSVYLEHFADFSAVYGSLGAVIAFMFFVYIASVLFLFGGEMTALWPRVRAGELDPDPDEPGKPFRRQVWDAVLGLFRRNEMRRRL